jgi:hypothetical protein
MDRAAVTAEAGFWPYSASMKILDQKPDRAEGKVAAKDGPDLLCVLLDDGELLAKALVAQGHGTADPDALALRGGDLVPHPLADHLALELGEGQEHIEGEPAHARSGVEGLRHRDEAHLMGIEGLDQLGEVGERAGQTIDLVDDDDSLSRVPRPLRRFGPGSQSSSPRS